MAQWNATALVVDDRDPSIHYSNGWQQVTGTSGSGEYLLTKSGASNAGLTASFTFNGTGVEVYGSQGSFDINGQPTTSYTVDGASDATYTAPIIQLSSYTVGNLYYRSPPLPDGLHELVITYLNGTSPSVYWLDYILYTPSTAIQLLASLTEDPLSPTPPIESQSRLLKPISATNAGQSATSVATSQSSPAPIIVVDTSSIPLTARPASGGPAPISSSTSTPASTNTETPVNVPDHMRGPSSGVVAGSIIAGLAFITFVVGLFWVWRRRKLRRARNTRRDAFSSLPVSRDPFRRITRASQYSDNFQYETPSFTESSFSTAPSRSDAFNAAVPSSPIPALSLSHIGFSELHKSTNEAGRRVTVRSHLYERFSFVEGRHAPRTTVAPTRPRNGKLQSHDTGIPYSQYASSSSGGPVFSVESKAGHYIESQEMREK